MNVVYRDGRELCIIRAETPADYKAAELMTMRSFWNKYWPGCSEHFLIRIIRESEDYIPEISRIAELDGRIIGAVYYTRAWIVDGDTRHEIATFGPLAVEPTLEGNNIGGILMTETIKLAKEAGIAGIALAGEPDYHPRFGFEKGAAYGITDPQGNTFDALMYLPLTDEARSYKGKFIESSDFEKLGDEKRLEEINREFPQYRRVKVQEGFMQIFAQHLGVVESIDGGTFTVRYWELQIPAELSDDIAQKPVKGSDVLFSWDHHTNRAVITKVVKNLLDEQ